MVLSENWPMAGQAREAFFTPSPFFAQPYYNTLEYRRKSSDTSVRAGRGNVTARLFAYRHRKPLSSPVPRHILQSIEIRVLGKTVEFSVGFSRNSAADPLSPFLRLIRERLIANKFVSIDCN